MWHAGERRENAYCIYLGTPEEKPNVVFGRSWVKISAWRPAIPTEGLRDFPQSLQANARIAP
jgi:hypothetical protein